MLEINIKGKIMSRYNLFSTILGICELVKTGEHCYSKMIQSGELAQTHYDYNRGYYDVSMYYLPRGNDEHWIRVWFGTIDDGDFGSWTKCENKEKALELLDKIKDEFKDMVVCPSHEKLNKQFEKLGVYFCNE